MGTDMIQMVMTLPKSSDVVKAKIPHFHEGGATVTLSHDGKQRQIIVEDISVETVEWEAMEALRVAAEKCGYTLVRKDQ